MPKVTVVYEKNTMKIIPFKYGDVGDIILLDSSSNIEDDVIVSRVDIERVDLDHNVILPEGEMNGTKKN